MKRVAILITHQAIIAAIGNTRYLFDMVNNFLKRSGKEPKFEVKLVGSKKEMKLNGGVFTIQVDTTTDVFNETDLVIIPPMSGDMVQNVDLNKEYISWITEQYRNGAEIASLCVGSFILADTGLLNGQQCSTHWQSANEFKHRFPEIDLVDEKIITDHNGLYTSGGSNSYWNLLVYLIEKYTDRETSIWASKYFEVERNRDSQSLFTIFEGSKLHEDDAVLAAQHQIEASFREKLNIDNLAALVHLGRRTFQRRFQRATHFTVKEYIQKIRIEAAKKLLEENKLSVQEVMYESGYSDAKAFRATFKKVSGVSPLLYRQKFK
ncbi:MAG: GlxA family transcriptional regulator [Ginsengibacter sp.]